MPHQILWWCVGPCNSDFLTGNSVITYAFKEKKTLKHNEARDKQTNVSDKKKVMFTQNVLTNFGSISTSSCLLRALSVSRLVRLCLDLSFALTVFCVTLGALFGVPREPLITSRHGFVAVCCGDERSDGDWVRDDVVLEHGRCWRILRYVYPSPMGEQGK